MTYKNLDEFHLDHDHQHSLNTVTIQDPSCPKCHLLEWQSAEFKQFLDWYRNCQSIKTFSQQSVEIFDWYLAELNKQQAEDGTLTNDQVKALGERAWFIVKSFRYQEKLSAKSAELKFYITKLAEAIRFDPKHLYEATY